MSSELTTPQTNFVFSSGGQDTVAPLPDSARTRHATNRKGSSLLKLSALRAATRRPVVELTRSIINSSSKFFPAQHLWYIYQIVDQQTIVRLYFQVASNRQVDIRISQGAHPGCRRVLSIFDPITIKLGTALGMWP